MCYHKCMVPIAIENFKILYFIIHIIKMFQSTSKLLKTIQLVSLTYSVFFKFYHFCFPFQRICVYGWVMGTMSHQLTESGLLFQLILHLLPRERKIFIHIDKSFKQTDAQHYNDQITCILFSNSEVQGVPNRCVPCFHLCNILWLLSNRLLLSIYHAISSLHFLHCF